ncbi:MAG TPA: hypothetical protein VG265_08975, partial [Gaiellaceae bacterium]|nr:hypothetical protein [Gaiellaceae bacterium]
MDAGPDAGGETAPDAPGVPPGSVGVADAAAEGRDPDCDPSPGEAGALAGEGDIGGPTSRPPDSPLSGGESRSSSGTGVRRDPSGSVPGAVDGSSTSGCSCGSGASGTSAVSPAAGVCGGAVPPGEGVEG